MPPPRALWWACRRCAWSSRRAIANGSTIPIRCIPPMSAISTPWKPVGTSRSTSKLERAKHLGLEMGIDASNDWVLQIEKAFGVSRIQAVLDLVGAYYLEANLRLLAVCGRMVVVGLTAGTHGQLDMGVLLRKRLTIVGTVLRARPIEEKIELAREFSERIVPFFEGGQLRPVIDRVFSFAEIRAAHELMESNRTFGKIVLRWD